MYFPDPHSPWQRRINKNTNGLLCQYFLKGTNLGIFPEDYFDAVAEEKTLGYCKPSKAMLETINDPARSEPEDELEDDRQRRCCDRP